MLQQLAQTDVTDLSVLVSNLSQELSTHTLHITTPVVGERDPLRAFAKAYPDAEAFLARLPISAETAEKFLPLVFRIGHENLFYLLAEAALIGIPADTVDTIQYHGNLNELANSERFSASLTVTDQTKSIGNKNTPEGRIKLFDCYFRSFDASHSVDIDGTIQDAQILAMFIPENSMAEIHAELDAPLHEHVFGAFAYIRYYELEQGHVIAEIQSDIYGKIESRSLREKYKHWSKMLLLAFEELQKQYQHTRTESGESVEVKNSVFLTDSDYQIARWPALALPLAKHLYDDLPQNLGYSKVKLRDDKIKLEFYQDEKQIEISQIWKKPEVAETVEGSLREAFSKLLIREDHISQEWLKAEQQYIHPLLVRLHLGGSIIPEIKTPELTILKECDLDLKQFAGMRASYYSEWEKVIQSYQENKSPTKMSLEFHSGLEEARQFQQRFVYALALHHLAKVCAPEYVAPVRFPLSIKIAEAPIGVGLSAPLSIQQLYPSHIIQDNQQYMVNAMHFIGMVHGTGGDLGSSESHGNIVFDSNGILIAPEQSWLPWVHNADISPLEKYRRTETRNERRINDLKQILKSFNREVEVDNVDLHSVLLHFDRTIQNEYRLGFREGRHVARQLRSEP